MTTVEQIIDRTQFSDDERDIATSGLCAMFALALFRTVIDQHPILALVGATRDGKPVVSRSGGLYWCHAVVKVGEDYYDIEGKQQVDWMFSNYAWGLPLGVKPAMIEMTPTEFITEIKSTNNARDRQFYTRWKNMLGN